ncbi:MAG: VOC family protein [Thermoplasmata archaeon]|jgi:catechol 2,3-dioxygenase-like lactoylglutathione lyase family enzyme|nr:VOC family protein [Thermoplasmata archaeon]
MNLNQVTVPSADVAASVEFYRRLGLRQIVETSKDYARFECPDGDSTFSVHRVDRVREGSGAVVYFECEELDQTVRDLKTRGILFDSDPEDQRWLWREARLHDPDGNILCLYHAGSNRRHPPWRIP